MGILRNVSAVKLIRKCKVYEKLEFENYKIMNDYCSP